VSVFRLPDGRWVHEHREGGKRVREYFGRDEAAARDRQAQVDVQRSAPGADGPRFDEVVVAYLEQHGPEMEASTVSRMARRLDNHILPVIGILPAAAITQEVMDGYVSRLRVRCGPNTCRKDCETVRAILRWGCRRKMLAFNPLADAILPREKPFHLSPPTQDEAHRIWQAARPHLRRFIALGWFLGARAGTEILGLTWGSCDLVAGTITIVSARKGGHHSRLIRIHPVLLEWMRLWRQEDDCPYIVHWRGKAVTRIKKAWAAAKLEAGITRRLRPYDLRAAFASSLIMSGADPRTVQLIMGHKKIGTTLERYTHASQQAQDRAIWLLPTLGSDPEGDALPDSDKTD